MHIWTFTIISVLAGPHLSKAQSKCADIDTSACGLMAAGRPDLCSDATLANSACPAYCKLCPTECYECDMPGTANVHCNTTRLCAKGEVCMKRELVSFMDGHREYQLSCETKEHCDGASLSLSFGKRGLASRDVDVSCCDTDLCNRVGGVSLTVPPTAPPTTTMPPTTTAKACKKDIIVLVDDSRQGFGGSGNGVNRFLIDIVSGLTVGPNDVLMSVVKFTNSTNKLWDLSTYPVQSSLENAIRGSDFMGEFAFKVDLDTALTYLLNYKFSSENRQNVEDVVLILTSHGAQNSARDQYLASQLKAQYPNVIVVGMSRTVDESDLKVVATDLGHEFTVRSATLLDTLAPQVSAMICP